MGDARLADVAHEALTVAPAAPLTFDAAQHLVSAMVGDRRERPRRLRARLARLLEGGQRPGLPLTARTTTLRNAAAATRIPLESPGFPASRCR